jgi:hypothetical protein
MQSKLAKRQHNIGTTDASSIYCNLNKVLPRLTNNFVMISRIETSENDKKKLFKMTNRD